MNARTPIAIALAALLAAPAAASAQTRRTTRATAPRHTTTSSTADALTVGGFIGFETGDLTGFALRADGELPFQQLSPQVKLSFVGSLGFTHFSKDVGAYGTLSFNLVKLVPAARFTLPLNPQFDLYGDAGLGLYYYSATAKTSFPGFPTVEATSSGVSLMMRLGAGGFYKVNPKVRIGAELGILPYFGKVDTTDFSIMAGAMFAI